MVYLPKLNAVAQVKFVQGREENISFPEKRKPSFHWSDLLKDDVNRKDTNLF